MKKRIYRAVNVKDVSFEALFRAVEGKRIVVGIDVAKEVFYAALMSEAPEVCTIVKWNHPKQTRQFVGLLKALAASCLDVAMEPSGTYGDALRFLLFDSGIPVFRVSAKRTHDAAEVFDGVPSKHDPKDAVIVARLQLDGLSEPWPLRSEQERDLAAGVNTMSFFSDQFQQNICRLEGKLARHWPEVTSLLKLGSKTLLCLLRDVGDPAFVAKATEKSRSVMRRAGGNFLCSEKIDAVIASAGHTLGVPLTAGERRALAVLAGDALRARSEKQKAEVHLKHLCRSDPSICAMGKVVGQTTAAVLFCCVGDPNHFAGAAAYEKCAGLNIKERSSGRYQGKRKITKRGSGMARKWLFLATLRLIRDCPEVRAWYERKIQRDGGKHKKSGVVAVMRKLIQALWHVGRGEAFDPARMYNQNLLSLDRT